MLKYALLFAAVFTSLPSKAQLDLQITPKISYSQFGDFEVSNSSGIFVGETFGTTLGLKLGAQYDYYRFGFSIDHANLGTRQEPVTGSSVYIDGRTISYRNFGPYVGATYRNFFLDVVIFIEEWGDLTDSDNNSYQLREGVQFSIGHNINENFSIGVELTSAEYRTSTTNGFEFLDIENSIGLFISAPIKAISFDI